MYKRFITIVCGVCYYYYKRKNQWYWKEISGRDQRYKSPIISYDIAQRIINQNKGK